MHSRSQEPDVENQQIAVLVALVVAIAVVGSVIATVLRLRAGAPGARPALRDGGSTAATGDSASSGSDTRDGRADDGGSPDGGGADGGGAAGAATEAGHRPSTPESFPPSDREGTSGSSCRPVRACPASLHVPGTVRPPRRDRARIRLAPERTGSVDSRGRSWGMPLAVPDALVPLALRLARANRTFVTADGARRRIRANALRPARYGPPRGCDPESASTSSRSAAGRSTRSARNGSAAESSTRTVAAGSTRSRRSTGGSRRGSRRRPRSR